MRCLVGIPLFALAAAAIEFVHPNDEAKNFEAGQELEVQWTAADTDPETLSLYLVRNDDSSYIPLAMDVGTRDGSRKVSIPTDVNPSEAYQITAVNGTDVSDVYAQSCSVSITNDDVNVESHKHKDDEEDDDDSDDEDSDDDDDDKCHCKCKCKCKEEDDDDDEDEDEDEDDHDRHGHRHRHHKHKHHKHHHKHHKHKHHKHHHKHHHKDKHEKEY